MKPTTLTLENIEAIIQAMDKIKPIDRSQCYNEYYDELLWRKKNELLWPKETYEAKETDKEQTETDGGG
ncbi:MAG: hypothetical protein ACOYOA_16395 [Saprospiraceae bacterium]